MKYLLFGGSGFIGTNLALKLAENIDNFITITTSDESHINDVIKKCININYKIVDVNKDTHFDELVNEYDYDYVIHLYSTTNPTTSNIDINTEIEFNIVVTNNLLMACKKANIKKFVFISSGGTVYGIGNGKPFNENSPTDPINSYGLQKLMIEKLTYLYNYQYGLNYNIVRLSNPYGPYQRPNGKLGVISTFIYKALKNDVIYVYGDGNIKRDFIYINDAITSIINITNYKGDYRIFNVGSGNATSINEIISIIKNVVTNNIKIEYMQSRGVDAFVNCLNVERYRSIFGKNDMINLDEGMFSVKNYLKKII